jgi:hypothetical protein
MALPLYVLLPDGVDWIEVPGTTAQVPRPIRWYLRQQMVDAATQTGVLVGEEDTSTAIDAVIEQATALGGVVVDAGTQEPMTRAADVVG